MNHDAATLLDLRTGQNSPSFCRPFASLFSDTGGLNLHHSVFIHLKKLSGGGKQRIKLLIEGSSGSGSSDGRGSGGGGGDETLAAVAKAGDCGGCDERGSGSLAVATKAI